MQLTHWFSGPDNPFVLAHRVLHDTSSAGRTGLSRCLDHDELIRAREVLQYFLHHPRAADDLLGLVHFRLLNEGQHNVEQTRSVLIALVEMGLLLEDSAVGCGPIYRLNPTRIDDVLQFVSAGLGRPGD